MVRWCSPGAGVALALLAGAALSPCVAFRPSPTTAAASARPRGAAIAAPGTRTTPRSLRTSVSPHRRRQDAALAAAAEHEDSPTDKLLIWLFGVRMAARGKRGANARLGMGYDDFVRLSKDLLAGGSARTTRAVLDVLDGLLPPGGKSLYRLLFPGDRKYACELNARITPIFFSWLVGPAEVQPVTREDGQVWASKVHISKCRYLEESGCTAACLSLCKRPTQTFFTEELGMPVSMTPDFETMSCDMVFGQPPLPLREDPAWRQGCLRTCSLVQESPPAAALPEPCARLPRPED